MATSKVTFTKLGLKKEETFKPVEHNGQTILVRQYLSIEDKIKLVTKVLELSADDKNNFANPMQIDVFFALQIIYNYTDISFTDKQKEDELKIYDLFEGSGLLDQIIAAIPENEYNLLYGYVEDTINSYWSYQNSAMGIMERISTDYSDLNFDAQQIKDNLADPGNLTLLKEVVEKLG